MHLAERERKTGAKRGSCRVRGQKSKLSYRNAELGAVKLKKQKYHKEHNNKYIEIERINLSRIEKVLEEKLKEDGKKSFNIKMLGNEDYFSLEIPGKVKRLFIDSDYSVLKNLKDFTDRTKSIIENQKIFEHINNLLKIINKAGCDTSFKNNKLVCNLCKNCSFRKLKF